jgi:hypothetical protein
MEQTLEYIQSEVFVMKKWPKSLKAPDKEAYLQVLSIKNEPDQDGDTPMFQSNVPSSSQTKGVSISSIGIQGINKVVNSMPDHPIINIGCQTQKN